MNKLNLDEDASNSNDIKSKPLDNKVRSKPAVNVNKRIPMSKKISNPVRPTAVAEVIEKKKYLKKI